ncbi:hypothetical protein BN7_5628 [Wickerhamomyces ciferrii]|uniref:Clu domain-containing protein n=1 Tax=Wickerhamomyces ciferrii (strain ATCC 14091 / BCRC 22168 / CBS 111 / JCM 3599 / NBRC 0793 / NRRL Y-1031 F-60-10) TaxID=1206466 RepID=K0KLA8_WICCF|nr:uncharacterized protein BN7_5628 [Wickerhamomyces ciferrii]CCH46040.1 hypothetical protein BN7_5628 [Wickerhamomyces ciferrii]
MAEEQPQNDTLTVNVSVKGAKPIELSLFKTETVNDVYQHIGVVPEAHHITSFDLFQQSQLLTPETLLADLVSSVQQKSIQLDLKPKTYTAKSILDHVAKTRDIVGLNEPETFGLNSGVSKINDLKLGKILENTVESEKEEEVLKETANGEESKAKEGEEEKPKAKELPKPTADEELEITQAIDNYFGELNADYYTPETIVTPAVRALHLSSWNPVPLNYKSQGHLAYIVVQTFESETLHVTGSTTGFFINKSSSSRFDPSPRENSNQSFTLYDLISKSSKNFLNIIKGNTDRLNSIDPITFLRPQTGFLANPWITKASNPSPDFGKTQFEDNTQRDFNDEYQSIKDFPTATLSDRIIRERLLTKTAYEFTSNAVKGALAVLTGAIAPMNPTDDSIDQIFLHNGIFFSFGVDASGFFETRGGNLAARASTNQDLKAIKFWNSVDAKGIYTLLTTIVDYAGKRVVCQTPVPGLFTSSEPKEVKNEETGEVELIDGEPLTKIDYGFDDASGTYKSNDEFVNALDPIRKAIHYKRVKVENGDGETVTNAEIKGMYGTDRRKYVLDLFNTTPLDVEFKDEHYHPEKEGSYPHRQLTTRIEAVQEWFATKGRELINKEAEKQGVDLSKKSEEGEENPKLVIDDEPILFTPDKCQTDENVRALSKFIKSDLIPSFLDSFDSLGNILPIDGAHLSSTMHKSGINIRYLGYIAQELEKRVKSSLESEEKTLIENKEASEAYEKKLEELKKKTEAKLKAKTEALQRGEEVPKDDDKDEEKLDDEEEDTDAYPVAESKHFQYFYEIVIQELIARAAKHVLRDQALSLPLDLVPALVSHFHNCLLGSSFNQTPQAIIEQSDFYNEKDLSFTKWTPEIVRELIFKDVQVWYRYDLPENWDAKFVKPVQLQREIALKFGIQWQQREYFFTKEAYEAHVQVLTKEKKSKRSRSVSPPASSEKLNVFEAQDVSLAPIIKDSIPRSTAGEQIFELGRQSLLQADESKKEEGLALISEAIAVYEQVYGQVHPEVAKLYATLAQLYQELGLKREATLLSRRSVAVSERTFGLDSHDTFVALLNLAFLEIENGSVVNMVKIYGLLTRIWGTIFSTQHVSLSSIVTNVIFYLERIGLNKVSLKLLNKLIDLTIKIHGKDSYAYGFLKYRYSYALAVDEKFKLALDSASEAYGALKISIGPKHYLTKQAKLLVDNFTAYQRVQSQNEKITKQRMKELAKKNQAEAQTQTVGKSNKSIKTKKEFESKSVDEVLAFVNGQAGSSKKNKKKNKK